MNKNDLTENFKNLIQIQKNKNNYMKEQEKINKMSNDDDYLKNILQEKLNERININTQMALKFKSIPKGIYEIKTNDLNPYGVKTYILINRRNIIALNNTAVYYINESMPRDVEIIPITDMLTLKKIAVEIVQLNVVNWDFNKNNKRHIKNFITDCLMDEYPFE